MRPIIARHHWKLRPLAAWVVHSISMRHRLRKKANNLSSPQNMHTALRFDYWLKIKAKPMYLIISICTYQVSNWGPEEEDDLLLPTALYFMNLKWSNLKRYCLTEHQLEAKTETIWIIFNNKLKTELTITQLLASSERCLVSLVVVVDVKVIVVIGLKSRLPPTPNFPGGKTNFFRLFWFCVKKW